MIINGEQFVTTNLIMMQHISSVNCLTLHKEQCVQSVMLSLGKDKVAIYTVNIKNS